MCRQVYTMRRQAYAWEVYMEQNAKIMVVDDDAEIREVIRILLESEGCNVLFSGDLEIEGWRSCWVEIQD